MAHRLLRTLVFSSSMLLEGVTSGCAESHPSEPDAGAPSPDAPPVDDAGPLDAAAPDAGSDAGRDAGADAPDAAVLEGDAGLVFCERGWPTTKAQSCTIEPSGFALCCGGIFVEDTGPECCIGRPEDRF